MTINTKALSAALSECGQAIQASNALPILMSVRLAVEAGNLEIEATNLEAWILRRMACEGEMKSCCVRHSTFKRVVDLVEAESITLTIDSGKLLIASGNSKVRLPIEPQEFPSDSFADAKPVDAMAAVATDLADGLDAVCWAACIDQSKHPIYENVLILMESHALKCVASRSVTSAIFHRLRICPNLEIILPAKHAGLLVPFLREESAESLLSKNYLIAKSVKGLCAVKLSAVGSVKWESVQNILDSRQGSGVLIASTLLKTACARTMLITDNGTPRLELEQIGGVLTLASGENYKDTIQSTGEPAVATLNATELLRALPKLNSDTVRFVSAPNGSFWSAGDLTVALCQMRK